MDFARLKQPFAPSDVSWRIGQAGKGRDGIWAKVLAYIDNRCIQDRLDEVCGPQNWKNEFGVGPGGGVLCGISIRIDNEWVTKWDGAENTDIEQVKGGLSDSMKRAAVQWGIGRYLYEIGESWAEILDKKQQGAHYANCKIKHDGKEEWAQFYWMPPRLPDFAMPPPPAASKAADVANQHGMKTGDQLLSGALKKALDKLALAVRNRSVDEVARISNVAAEAKSKGQLSQNEFTTIEHECELALKKIRAMDHEPAAA